MSYTSESILPPNTKLLLVKECVELLGYKKVSDHLQVAGRVASYFWFETKDYKSFTGVELDLYQTKSGRISITTRSRASRSYWDLVHQNQTLKLIRDLFKGHFITDAGRNRYWRPDKNAPSSTSAGCYIARWLFNNALSRARYYHSQDGHKHHNGRTSPTGIPFIDETDPKLMSNNFVIPYLIGVWEEYFKSTFIALLRYSPQRELAFKRAKLSNSQLEEIATGKLLVEEAFANTLSFQKPSIISENFKLLDPRLDIVGVLRKPYRRRKKSLYDSIESRVNFRHELVHTGNIDIKFTDHELKSFINDIEVAADRIYVHVAKHYGFTPIRDY